jgi:hypothetical protein
MSIEAVYGAGAVGGAEAVVITSSARAPEAMDNTPMAASAIAPAQIVILISIKSPAVSIDLIVRRYPSNRP